MEQASAVARTLDQGERLFFLDAVIRLAQQKMKVGDLMGLTGAAGSTAVDLVSTAQVDWNSVLREGNRWYDRLVAASRRPTYAERQREFSRIQIELGQLGQARFSPLALLGSLVSRNRRTDMFGNLLLQNFLPAVNAAKEAEDRSSVLLEMTRVEAALAVYRAREDEYPEKLAQLMSDVQPRMPLDLYSERPFLYERKPDGGYLLYSVFSNGTDDGGTHYDGEIIEGEWVDEEDSDFDYNRSDIVIRVPVPKFKMPEPPTGDEFGP